MRLFEQLNNKKYHTRTIEVTTSDYDETRLAVEGNLIDRRYDKYRLITGEERPAGKLHSMVIQLLVNKTTLEIEEVAVDMPVIPNEECPRAVDSLDGLKGMAITKGFVAKIKKMAAQGKGCTHLVELLTAMAPAIVQGVISYRVKEFPDFSLEMMKDFIRNFMNTCYAWRPEGVLVGLLRKRLEKGDTACL